MKILLRSLTGILLVCSSVWGSSSGYIGEYKSDLGVIKLRDHDKKSGKLSFDISLKVQKCSLEEVGDSYQDNPGRFTFYFLNSDNKGKKTVQGKCDATFTFDTVARPIKAYLVIGDCDSEHSDCKDLDNLSFSKVH